MSLPPAPPGRSSWPWSNQPPSFPASATDRHACLKISIVTPSYNQGQFLEETIRSVLLQGYPNVEYIIIDGGSSDNSAQIIRKYEHRLAYWTSEADKGQSDAIRKGFQRATGDILAWLNSDDYYQQDALARVARFFAGNPGIVFANGDVNVISSEGQLLKRIYAMRPSAFFAANYGRHGWPQQGCFWRKDTYDQVGGVDASLQFCMDKDLFIRLVNAGPSQRLPGPPLANYRVHKGAKSSTLGDIARGETMRIVNTYGQRKWVSRPRLGSALWWLYRKQAALRMHVER